MNPGKDTVRKINLALFFPTALVTLAGEHADRVEALLRIAYAS